MRKARLGAWAAVAALTMSLASCYSIVNGDKAVVVKVERSYSKSGKYRVSAWDDGGGNVGGVKFLTDSLYHPGDTVYFTKHR